MCGIAGIFDLTGQREPDRDLLAAMNQTQFHRGPDEGGLHTEPGLGLAHRRLSIIDLASGQQPMFSADGNLCVSYNGEIYNFRELMQELRRLGYEFRTHCDTEVILYAWQEWGAACVERFRGMFAFGLYDRAARSLFLARDRFGIKPLFYSVLPDGQLIFGSELKVLKAHPQLSRQLEPRAVEDYFALGYVPEPKTIYRDVYKLRPTPCCSSTGSRCRHSSSTGTFPLPRWRWRARPTCRRSCWRACARRCRCGWWRRCPWAPSSPAGWTPVRWWR